MTKLIKIKQLIKQFFSSLKNQKLTLATTVLSTVFGILSVFDILDSNNLSENLFITFLCSTIVTFPSSILTKKLKTWLQYLIQITITIVFSTIFYIFISKPSDYHTMYCMGLVFFFAALTVFLFIPKENAQSYFANLLKHFLFCGLLSTVLFGGFSLLIAAFNSLIFEFTDSYKIYESFAIFCFILFYINIFTFYLFEKRTEPSGKGFKIIFLYALFPVYAVLLVVLYSYLVKALVLFKLPQGQLNWFVSFATVFYIVFWFILREYKDNKFVTFFYKYGAIILLPLICVQIPAYIIRVNAYGFTGWRYSSLLYTIFATLTILSTFIKKAKYTDYAIVVLGVFILFASISPFNLIDSAYNSQYKRMRKILTKYEMLVDDSINTENAKEIENNITDKDRQQLYSSYKYLTEKTEHTLPVWLTNKNNSFTNTFGIYTPNDDDSIYFISKCSITDEPLNISNYSSMKEDSITFYSYNKEPSKEIVIILNDGTEVDITDFILSLKEENKYFYYPVNDQITLCIFNIEYRYNKFNEAFSFYSVHAYELRK